MEDTIGQAMHLDFREKANQEKNMTLNVSKKLVANAETQICNAYSLNSSLLATKQNSFDDYTKLIEPSCDQVNQA